MKLGIIGRFGAGKATVMAALSGARGIRDEGQGSRADSRIVTLSVPDARVDILSRMFSPEKTTYARVTYLLPSLTPGVPQTKAEAEAWNQVRPCDALVLVVRNFPDPGLGAPHFEEDYGEVEGDMIVNDLAVAEKRLERMTLDEKRGKKPDAEELALVRLCREFLDTGKPLRERPDLAEDPRLRGFTFLSAKPLLVIVNNGDEDREAPAWKRTPAGVELLLVRARLEKDLALLSPEEAREFQEAYAIEVSALDRVVDSSYRLLKRMSFFTVGEDEVRAWTVPLGTSAVDAAGAVHTDMKKGFIRAEVIAYDDLMASGGMKEARKAGLVRLEGRDYTVKDGDIVNFRFNL